MADFWHLEPLCTVELWKQNGAKKYLKAYYDFATLLSIWRYFVYNCYELQFKYIFWRFGVACNYYNATVTLQSILLHCENSMDTIEIILFLKKNSIEKHS